MPGAWHGWIYRGGSQCHQEMQQDASGNGLDEGRRMWMCKRVMGAQKSTSGQALSCALGAEESWWPVPHSHNLTKGRNLRLKQSDPFS